MTRSTSSRDSEELIDGTPADPSKNCCWHADIPIRYTPLFDFPPKPAAIARWYARQWLPFTELGCYALLAFAVWKWLQPPLAETVSLAPGWIFEIWLHNLLMMITIATALHLWLYSWRDQQDQFRFSRTAPTARKRLFLGGHQLLDNLFWTLATATSHSEYRALVLRSAQVDIATFFHQLHHRYFTCNYGNTVMPLDRWFGSFNDGTTAATRHLFQRQRSARHRRCNA